MFAVYANSEKPFLVAVHGQCLLYGPSISSMRISLVSVIKMLTLGSREKLNMPPDSTQ